MGNSHTAYGGVYYNTLTPQRQTELFNNLKNAHSSEQVTDLPFKYLNKDGKEQIFITLGNFFVNINGKNIKKERLIFTNITEFIHFVKQIRRQFVIIRHPYAGTGTCNFIY